MHNLRHLALSIVVASTVVACGGDDDSGSSRPATATSGDAFCLAGEQMASSLDALGAAFDTGDPAEVEAAMKVVLTDGASVTKIAPDDIHEQISSIVGTWGSLATVLEDNEWNLEAATADPDFLSEEESAGLDATGSEIEAYLLAKCGLEP